MSLGTKVRMYPVVQVLHNALGNYTNRFRNTEQDVPAKQHYAATKTRSHSVPNKAQKSTNTT